MKTVTTTDPQKKQVQTNNRSSITDTINSGENEHPTLDRHPPWTALFALLSGTFAVVLSLSFLFSATPLIMQDFGVSIEMAAWLSLSYALGATVFEPMFGRLGDIHGRKRNVLLGLTTFSVGAIIAAVSPQFWVMVAARFVQGLGAAAVIPVGMAFVGENFPLKVRGRALGLWSMTNAAAPAIGPALGGILIDLYAWRAIYWFSLALGLVGIVMVAVFVPETRRIRKEPFDYAGSAALFVAVGSLIVLLTQGRSWGWISLNTLLFATSAIIGGLAFVLLERRAAYPLVDLHFLKSRVFLIPALVVFLSFFIFQGSFFMLPFFLEQVQGYNAAIVGSMAVPLFVALAVSSFFGGSLSDRFRVKYIVVAGAVLTVIPIYLFTELTMDAPYWYILVIMAFLGLGIGITLPPLSRSVIGMVKPQKMGVVSGIFNMFRNLGGPVGIGVAATLFANQVITRAKDAFITKATQLGVPATILEALGKIQQGGQIDPSLAAQLKAWSPQLAELEQYARMQGMTSAMADVAWVLLGVGLFALLVTLILPNLSPPTRDPRKTQTLYAEPKRITEDKGSVKSENKEEDNLPNTTNAKDKQVDESKAASG